VVFVISANKYPFYEKVFTCTSLFIALGAVAFGQAPTPTSAQDSTHYWTIHGVNTLLINQSSFKDWAAGGVNAMALNAVMDYDFDYKKDKWSWDNKVILGYGLSDIAGTGWRKNDDRIILNSLLGYQAAKYWLYTFYANFQSQFTNGYSYNGNQRTIISGPFAPAYITFGPGIAYKRSDNFRINISPAAIRLTLVDNDTLSSIGAFGVTPGKRSLLQFGASLDAYYKVDIAKNITFENILKMYTNYLKQPQDVFTDYTANLYMKVNKLVTVNAGVELVNDPLARIPFTTATGTDYHFVLQVKQIFGAGVTYKF
jgi:hypothetical protein